MIASLSEMRDKSRGKADGTSHTRTIGHMRIIGHIGHRDLADSTNGSWRAAGAPADLPHCEVCASPCLRAAWGRRDSSAA